jgi:hypothetical protein
MGTRRDKQLDPNAPAVPGQIAVDSRGRNVWQWSQEQLDSTTIMLQSLENSALALEPTLNVRRPETGDTAAASRPATGSARRDPASRAARREKEQTGELKIEQTLSFKLGGGFDPYNRS